MGTQRRRPGAKAPGALAASDGRASDAALPPPRRPGPPDPRADATRWLALSMGASDPEDRARYARAGLAALPLGEDGAAVDGIDLDTQYALLRQLYAVHLAQRAFRRAARVAEQMAALGTGFTDIAHHDASRAWAALGELPAALGAQRLAARAAPPTRRSFHYWCLGTLEHFAGDVDGALASLGRGLRWARRDRPLLRAHAAYIRLEAGRAVPALAAVLASLSRARCREGYGQFLLGMLWYHAGDTRRASLHLRAFLDRHADADPARVATLREELRRARLVLASSLD
jgi:hypothetical protein